MAYPVVPGHPDYTRSGASKFIPEIWSGKLLKKYYDYTILTSICNTDYEGEIKNQGDTIIIRSITPFSVKAVKKAPITASVCRIPMS